MIASKSNLLSLRHVLVIAMMAGHLKADEPGTAFTWQGQLRQGTAAVNGVMCDISFSVWDSPVRGTQLEDEQTRQVALENGLINVVLDFGMDVFDGKPRWLEISVQCDGDDDVSTFDERQAITYAPYAVTAINSVNLDGRPVDDFVISVIGGEGLTAERTLGEVSISVNTGTGLVVDGDQVRIASGGVGSNEIASGAVTTADLAPNAVDGSRILDESVTRFDIGADAVRQSELAPNAVNSGHIVDNSITADDIGNDAVRSSELAENAVSQSELAPNAVNTDHIANGAVRSADLASDQGSMSMVSGGIMTASGSNISIDTGSGSSSSPLRVHANDSQILLTHTSAPLAASISYNNFGGLPTNFGGVSIQGRTTSGAFQRNLLTLSLGSGFAGFGVSNPQAPIHMADGAICTGTNWVNVSDRSLKENISIIDSREFLERVATLPISRWNYISEGPGILHVGPMAQDFHAAFGLGSSEKSIGTLDADGVALAAIQGAYEIIREQDQQIKALVADVDAMKARLSNSNATETANARTGANLGGVR